MVARCSREASGARRLRSGWPSSSISSAPSPADVFEAGSAVGSVVAAYGLAAIAGVGLALVRDPFLDPYCWRNCLENVFLLRPEQTRRERLATGWQGARWRSGRCSAGASVAVGCCRQARAARALAGPPARSAGWRHAGRVLDRRFCERPSRTRGLAASRRSSCCARSRSGLSRSASRASSYVRVGAARGDRSSGDGARRGAGSRDDCRDALAAAVGDPALERRVLAARHAALRRPRRDAVSPPVADRRSRA